MPKFNIAAEDQEKDTKATAKREISAVDRFVGARIRLYRGMLGVSQQELAEQLGVTFQQLQKYERGENRIGAGRLLLIATALGIPITFLLDEKTFLQHGESAIPPDAEAREISREGYQVGRAFSQIMDPEVRRSISDLVEKLARRADDP